MNTRHLPPWLNNYIWEFCYPLILIYTRRFPFARWFRWLHLGLYDGSFNYRCMPTEVRWRRAHASALSEGLSYWDSSAIRPVGIALHVHIFPFVSSSRDNRSSMDRPWLFNFSQPLHIEPFVRILMLPRCLLTRPSTTIFPAVLRTNISILYHLHN